jgi:hypothetical protein
MIVERRIHSGCGQIAGVGRGQEGLDVVLIIVGQMTASGTEEVTVGMRRLSVLAGREGGHRKQDSREEEGETRG